jgi:hypothetical protein
MRICKVYYPKLGGIFHIEQDCVDTGSRIGPNECNLCANLRLICNESG